MSPALLENMLHFLPLFKIDILVVGLGNPGEQYCDTPHNAGFDVVDTLASRIESEDISLKKYTKYNSLVHEVRMGRTAAALVKPQVFMNSSGQVVARLVKRYRLKNLGSLWLVHDDIDLSLGHLRVTFNRGSGGHRGVQDVIDRVGSTQFYRFRFGIRPHNMPDKRSPELMRTYVTKKMDSTVMDIFGDTSHFCANLMHKGLLGVPMVELLGDYTVTQPPR